MAMIDYNNTSGSSYASAQTSLYMAPAERKYIIQSFVASKDYSLSSVNLLMGVSTAGTNKLPGIVRLEIYKANENDLFTGSILAYGTTNGNTLQDLNKGGDWEWRLFTLNTMPVLVADAKYILLLYIPNPSSSQSKVVFCRTNLDIYSDGIAKYSDHMTYPDYPGEDDWFNYSTDIMFETYGTVKPNAWPPDFGGENGRPADYDPDEYYDPATQDWTSDPTDLSTLGGGKYGKHLLAVGHKKLYYGSL